MARSKKLGVSVAKCVNGQYTNLVLFFTKTRVVIGVHSSNGYTYPVLLKDRIGFDGSKRSDRPILGDDWTDECEEFIGPALGLCDFSAFIGEQAAIGATIDEAWAALIARKSPLPTTDTKNDGSLDDLVTEYFSQVLKAANIRGRQPKVLAYDNIALYMKAIFNQPEAVGWNGKDALMRAYWERTGNKITSQSLYDLWAKLGRPTQAAKADYHADNF